MENRETATQVIRIGFIIILLVWSFLLFKPFLLIILWAIIIAVALSPIFDKLLKLTKGKHKKLITLSFALIITAACLIPSYFVVQSIAQSASNMVHNLQDETFELHQLEEKVQDWPLVGQKLHDNWNSISQKLQVYIVEHKEDLLEKGKAVFSSITGLVGTMVTFFFSLLLSLIFIYYSDAGYAHFTKFMKKLMGDKGEEVVIMSRDTTRSVVKGIILVAVIQTLLAFIGFKAVGLPGTGVFTLLVLVAATVQIPAIIVMLPAIVIVFSTSDSTTVPIVFALYSIAAGLSDNVLKPILLGKGLQTPMIVILIGTIGGLILHGIIGLFVGAVVLAVMHSMYNLWVNSDAKPRAEALEAD